MTDARLRNTALLVAGCFFMENLDGTIVITAAPRIGRALGVPSTSVGLVIAAYMVTLAVLIPLSGWLAARWGARTVFLSAIAIFTLSSLACAASTTFAELVAFRVLQGVGGAMMVPVGPARRALAHRQVPDAAHRGAARVAGAAGPGDRAVGRRSHHHLRELAVAVPGQRAARGGGAGRRLAPDRLPSHRGRPAA